MNVTARTKPPLANRKRAVPAPVVDGEKSTLAQVVYERLKEDLFDFRMAPGQRYSEQELATRLGVSRTPLRFALHILAREGYLQRVEGHTSWQVRPWKSVV